MLIILENSDISNAPIAVQRYIISLLKATDALNDDLDSNSPANNNVANLTVKEAGDLFAGCSEKTRKALLSIVKQGQVFTISKIGKDVGEPANAMRGIWAGLTKRVRTVTSKADVILIDWFGAPKLSADGVYIDQEGRVTAQTYESLVRALQR